MIVGVPREVFPGERRVALVPESVRRLTATKISAWVEGGAGQAAGFSDDEYSRAAPGLNPPPNGYSNKRFARQDTTAQYSRGRAAAPRLNAPVSA